MTEPNKKKREINIPFQGFYYSSYSNAIDSHEEREAEWLAEKEIEEAKNKVLERETGQTTFSFADREGVEIDESQCVNKHEFAELFFKHTDYGKVYDKVAKFYAEAFEMFAERDLDLPADSFEFALMVSPREYNFTTDRLFCNVSDECVEAMWNRSVADDHETLAEVIKERFTSYDGFISSYDNDLEAWLAKSLAEWDHNELGTLLLAYIRLCDYDREHMEETLYEYTFSGNGEEDEAIDAGRDWKAYEADLEKLRAKKREAANHLV